MNSLDEIFEVIPPKRDPKSEKVSVTLKKSVRERLDKIRKVLEERGEQKRLTTAQSLAQEFVVQKFEQELGIAG
jgi:hypothetical protein